MHHHRVAVHLESLRDQVDLSTLQSGSHQFVGLQLRQPTLPAPPLLPGRLP
jgi:hypothetical protein